jgi:hypothetical protein
LRRSSSVVAGLAVAFMLLVAVGTEASEWGAIVPAESTLDTVRAQYGEPAKRSTQQVDGYDTTEWVYEGDRAPRGLRRLTVSFGLLTPQGYRPELVRTFRLEPVRGVFTQGTVVIGWGEPSAIGRQGDAPAILYDAGLIVVFEPDGWHVREMIFTPPQPKSAR